MECWISLYEKTNYNGGKKTFNFSNRNDPETNVDVYPIEDLHDYDYEGESGVFHQVDDSANSFRSGEDAWTVLFSDDHFKDNIVKIDPSARIEDVNDLKSPINGKKVNNCGASLKFWDKEPNFWNVNNATRKNPVMLKIFEGKNFQLDSVCNFIFINGEIEYTRYLNLILNPDWEDDTANSVSEYWLGAGSIIVGDSAYVELYSKENFEGNTYQFGPGSYILDLSQYIGDDKIYSIKVHSQKPQGWSGSTNQLPALVSQRENYQTTSKITSVISDIIGFIPYAENVEELLYDALWPTGPSSQDVWNDLGAYFTAIMQTKISEEYLNSLNLDLSSYGNNMSLFVTYPPGYSRGEKFNDIVDDLSRDEGSFFPDSSTTDPASLLTYQVAFTSFYLFMLWFKAYKSSEILGVESTEEVQKTDIQFLDDKVDLYLGNSSSDYSIDKCVQDAMIWRKNQISVENDDLLEIGSGWFVYDGCSGFIYGEGSNEDEAKNLLPQVQDYICDNFQLQLNLQILPTNIYKYLNSKTEGSPSLTMANYPLFFGVDGGSSSKELILDGRTITNIEIFGTGNKSKEYPCGLNIALSDGTNVLFGATSDYSVQKSLDPDEKIVAFSGRSGDFLNQLYIRTDKGLDLGIGGSGGSFPFYVSTPMGLLQKSNTTTDDNIVHYLDSIKCQWNGNNLYCFKINYKYTYID